MRADLRADIYRRVTESAGKIQDILPSHSSHPKGRIAHAHIYDVIKQVMGKPSKDCSDTRYNDICEIIVFCVEHATEMHICSQLYDKYEKEPTVRKRTFNDITREHT